MMLLSLLAVAFSSEPDHTFKQQIDHTNESVGVFDQWYYEYNEFFDPKDGLVILKIGSETDYLDESGVSDWMHDLAKHFKAVVFTLQHRYYGKSVPFEELTADNLQYLSVDQALADYANFHDNVVSDVTGQTVSNLPWIVIGGSYPGLLSANLRRVYPDRFAAAISSAGVVYAQSDYTDFYLQVAITMGHVCAEMARKTRRLVTNMWKENKEYVMHLFNFPDMTDFEFQDTLGSIFEEGAQMCHIHKLCNRFEDVLVEGSDPVTMLANHVKGNDVLMSKLQKKFANFKANRKGNSLKPNAGVCWQWQTCSELGYWQTYPGRLGLVGQEMTQKAFEDGCKDSFGIEMHPDVEKFNREHPVGKGSNISHVIFSTGSQDPWTWACVTEDYEAVDPDNWVVTIIGDEVGHHREFNKPEESDPQNLKDTRKKMITLLDKWVAEWKDTH